MDGKIRTGKTEGLFMLLDKEIWEWPFVAKLSDLYEKTHGGKKFKYGKKFTQDDLYDLFEAVTGSVINRKKSKNTDYICCAFENGCDPGVLKEIAPYIQGEITWSERSREWKGIFRDGVYMEKGENHE